MHSCPPFGITKQANCYTFCLATSSDSVTLNLFEKGACVPFLTQVMDLAQEGLFQTSCYDLPSYFEYTYIVKQDSHTFESLDPYAHHLTSHNTFLEKSDRLLRSCYYDTPAFDWEDDSMPLHPLQNTVVYEAHVRGFTQHASSQKAHKSSFLNLINKIPHLKKLGITTLELLPLFEFDETAHPIYGTKGPLCNFWGYSTRAFFALMHRYGSHTDTALTEFKQMVKALHKADIEIILDVVFNHTDEGDKERAFHNFSALNKKDYFILSNNEHTNYSGCGNTFSCNSPLGMHLILSSLRYWVKECHVDGFRFDLASILYRDESGHVLERPPVIEAMRKDPILSKCKFFVEPWDAAGLYQLGSFSSYRFCEWNDKFRDDVRDFLRGQGSKSAFINRLMGSPDVWPSASPLKSLNYITVHDGFSLFDVCAFTHKYNTANGEKNLDGANENKSWNCGEEGLEVSSQTNALRLRQMKNFFLALFTAQGVPLLLMGDEYGHTKEGNNNTYCHDNHLNYFRWDQLEKNKPLFDFVIRLTEFRRETPYFRKDTFRQKEAFVDLCKGDERRLFLVVDKQIALLFNTSADPFSFTLPTFTDKAHVIASSEASFEERELVHEKSYKLPPFSSMCLSLEKRALTN